MKKILAVVLCLCMVIAILAGCSKTETPSSSTPSSSTPSSSQGSSTPASSDTPEPSGDEMSPAEKAIADRKASGNYPKVIFSFFTWDGAPAGRERISNLLSEYCKEQIGVDVQLLIMDVSSYRQQLPLMFASGAGANGSRTIGVGTIGGMFFGTLGLLLVVPTLFVVFQTLQERFKPLEVKPSDDPMIQEELKRIEEYRKKKEVTHE